MLCQTSPPKQSLPRRRKRTVATPSQGRLLPATLRTTCHWVSGDRKVQLVIRVFVDVIAKIHMRNPLVNVTGRRHRYQPDDDGRVNVARRQHRYQPGEDGWVNVMGRWHRYQPDEDGWVNVT